MVAALTSSLEKCKKSKMPLHSNRTHGKDTNVPKLWTHKSEIEPGMPTHTVAIIHGNGDAASDDGDDANDDDIVGWLARWLADGRFGWLAAWLTGSYVRNTVGWLVC